MQYAGNQRLVGNAFLCGTSLDFRKVRCRQPDIDTLVLAEGRTSILAIPTQRRFGGYRRFKLARFESRQNLLLIAIKIFHGFPLILYSRIALRLRIIVFRKWYGNGDILNCCEQPLESRIKKIRMSLFLSPQSKEFTLVVSLSRESGTHSLDQNRRRLHH